MDNQLKSQINIEDEMKRSYLDYAMSVIIGRALPDVRDGLKPVHRRILYSMNEKGLLPGKPYKKSANVVGDVLGAYHPHGDTAVYDSMVRSELLLSWRNCRRTRFSLFTRLTSAGTLLLVRVVIRALPGATLSWSN